MPADRRRHAVGHAGAGHVRDGGVARVVEHESPGLAAVRDAHGLACALPLGLKPAETRITGPVPPCPAAALDAVKEVRTALPPVGVCVLHDLEGAAREGDDVWCPVSLPRF